MAETAQAMNQPEQVSLITRITSFLQNLSLSKKDKTHDNISEQVSIMQENINQLKKSIEKADKPHNAEQSSEIGELKAMLGDIEKKLETLSKKREATQHATATQGMLIEGEGSLSDIYISKEEMEDDNSLSTDPSDKVFSHTDVCKEVDILEAALKKGEIRIDKGLSIDGLSVSDSRER